MFLKIQNFKAMSVKRRLDHWQAGTLIWQHRFFLRAWLIIPRSNNQLLFERLLSNEKRKRTIVLSKRSKEKENGNCGEALAKTKKRKRKQPSRELSQEPSANAAEALTEVLRICASTL